MAKSKAAVRPETAGNKKQRNNDQKPKERSFPIIAIGGSAGSFSAYEKFFSQMPPESGMAIVIIMHLDPLHKSQLVEVMQRYTAIPVIEAADGMEVEQDHVYIIPANKDMGIHNNKLLLLTASKPHGIRQPIDYFFQSLANDQWNQAIAIILSGMGADGETGIRMVKENLGLTVAQNPDTAEYDSMPLAAIGTNLIDYVLPPEGMPLKIMQYLKHPVIAEEENEDSGNSARNVNALQKILMLLRSHTGNDFALYKKSTITRRIDRRVAYYQFSDYARYAAYLNDNPEEITILFNELLIGVTKFFRDAAAFESLKHSLHDLFRSKNIEEPIRIWIAGCSTGEEAYSVAMLVMETLNEQKRKPVGKIQIYATDLDTSALDHARAALYHENIAAEISPERLKQFFFREDDRYRVKKELRDLIVFAQQNLIKDPPFIKLDLVCCRNMLIYFTPELQKKIIPLFYYALNPDGIMFMGPAETIGGFTDMFRSVDPKWKIFRRLEGKVTVGNILDFPFHSVKQPSAHLIPDEVIMPKQKRPVTELFNKILIEKFLPPSVLVNERGDILYNNGNTGKYLELPRGETVINNILKLAREELQYTLSSSLQQALQRDEIIIAENVSFKDDKITRVVNIKSTAVRETGMPPLILVVFEDQGSIKKYKKGAIQPDIAESDALKEMKKELVFTKQRLITTVEEMESSIEKLRMSNEELQSTNEELQSTNEESLTTKEEMQSLNEELMTVNSQYQAKAEELTRLNNDMKNLLDATEVCTLFLDNELNIVRYTPKVRHLFNLIPSDIGRPISHVVSNFVQPVSVKDIQEVIDNLTIKTSDMQTTANEWYRMRIMPYRTLDNYIAGVVITLTLITDYKQMQSSLEVLKDYSASVLDGIPEATLRMDKAMVIIGANTPALALFGLPEQEILGLKADDFLNKKWKTGVAAAILKQSLHERREVSATVTIKGKPAKTLRLQAIPFFEQTDTTPLLILKIYESQIAT
ncbi:CheR family methyltransferase [Mucilaginibacter aquaedulcis]|uniref:CheR family methyltransferase n=1 Tax=Mucilaginibacter aquaedulcis TaxID=1187081 RepID=UPI0025B3B984|nr:CheR family methyltransferase [Mucilaginibacter aquaedulcis]MDN3550215.1 CheR family methyltransferase [Mucilaginibacter aquaedulcis]